MALGFARMMDDFIRESYRDDIPKEWYFFINSWVCASPINRIRRGLPVYGTQGSNLSLPVFPATERMNRNRRHLWQ
jgi:hypothetical protein